MARMTPPSNTNQGTLPGLEHPLQDAADQRPGHGSHEAADRGVTLVLGPANSGKMGFALRWWQERLPRQPLVVVPTLPDALNLNQEMVRRVGALVAQTPALTFDGLVAHVLKSRPRYLSSLQRATILERLVGEMPLGTLREASTLPGATPALAALLQELEESGHRPEESARAVRQWRDAGRPGDRIAEDILRLLPAYAEARDRLGATDRPMAVIEAAARVAGWRRPVVCYGFTSFTPGQRKLLLAIAAEAPVLVTLPFERGREINLTSRAELEDWEGGTARVIEMAAQPQAYSSPVVYYLERNFMRERPLGTVPPRSDGPLGVRFLLASGRRNEAELVAQQIVGLLREGTTPGSIGVIVRDVPAWRRLLSDVLGSCGIPHQVEGQVALSDTGFGSAFLSALRGLISSDAGSFLAFLRSPFSGMERERTARIELDYRRQGSPGVGQLLGSLDGPLSLALERLGLAVVRGGPGRLLETGSLEALAQVMLTASLAGNELRSAETQEDVKAFVALTRALEELAASWPSGSFEWDRVMPLLRQVSISTGESGREDVVRVLSLQRARARRFDVVFVLGLVDGELPGKRSRPSLLSPEQRARLTAAGGGRLLADDRGADEAALFLGALSRPWRLLYLSARDTDDSGQQAAPSFFWDLARRLVGGDSEPARRGLGDVVFRADQAPGLRHYLRACVHQHVAAHPAIQGSAAARIAPRWQTSLGRLCDPVNLATLASRRSFAPSALERYLSCPFAWFVETVIGIRDMEPEVDGSTIGRLGHEVLSATYRDLASRREVPVCGRNLPMVLELAYAHVERVTGSVSCPGTASERRLAAWKLRTLVSGFLVRDAETESALVPAETEVRVGDPEGVDIGGLRVHGRIDRIDAGRAGTPLFVIDYKTGDVPRSSQLGAEGGLQLPLYLLAIAAERPRVQVVGGVYVSLATGKRSGLAMAGSDAVLGSWTKGCKALSADEAVELYGAAIAIAFRAAEGMQTGAIPPCSTECPPYCGLGPVCRSRRKGYRR